MFQIVFNLVEQTDNYIKIESKVGMPFSNLFVGIELTRLSGDGLGLVSLIHNTY